MSAPWPCIVPQHLTPSAAAAPVCADPGVVVVAAAVPGADDIEAAAVVAVAAAAAAAVAPGALGCGSKLEVFRTFAIPPPQILGGYCEC